jgi:hypothetical protein
LGKASLSKDNDVKMDVIMNEFDEIELMVLNGNDIFERYKYYFKISKKKVILKDNRKQLELLKILTILWEYLRESEQLNFKDLKLLSNLYSLHFWMRNSFTPTNISSLIAQYILKLPDVPLNYLVMDNPKFSPITMDSHKYIVRTINAIF